MFYAIIQANTTIKNNDKQLLIVTYLVHAKGLNPLVFNSWGRRVSVLFFYSFGGRVPAPNNILPSVSSKLKSVLSAKSASIIVVTIACAPKRCFSIWYLTLFLLFAQASECLELCFQVLNFRHFSGI